VVTHARETPESIDLWGGALALDLANTVDWAADGTPYLPERTDVLDDPERALRWARRVGLLAPGPPPTLDAAELARLRALRDAAHRTFSAVAGGRPAAEDDLATIAASHASSASGTLALADGAYRLEWPADDARRVRLACAADVVALLGDAERLRRVHRCPGRDCGWLFLDTSGRRRWCSMRTCGSREKMRRHRARARS
jgi:predicted RNA-binding Zn ribbon-like protein